MTDCAYHIWTIKENGDIGCSRCDYSSNEEVERIIALVRPRCPWAIPLDEICPVHGKTLRDCPLPEERR